MDAVNHLFDWLGDVMGAVVVPQFKIVDGGLPASNMMTKDFLCVVQGRGGAPIDVDDRKPNYRVLLLGREKTRSDVATVRSAEGAIVQAILDESAPCGMAGIKAMGEPVGPAYTAEDRAWMSLDLQLIY